MLWPVCFEDIYRVAVSKEAPPAEQKRSVATFFLNWLELVNFSTKERGRKLAVAFQKINGINGILHTASWQIPGELLCTQETPLKLLKTSRNIKPNAICRKGEKHVAWSRPPNFRFLSELPPLGNSSDLLLSCPRSAFWKKSIFLSSGHF